jgi:hypothetical protein
MHLTITYIPNVGMTINKAEINWGTQREIIRKLLNNNHKAQDSINDDANISQKRDVYKNYNGSDNFFFLNYNKNNKLIELEVHDGVEIIVGSALLSFEKELSAIVEDLQTISPLVTKIGDCEYFFKDLKLTISDLEAMGGDGSVLGYFYCSVNTDHLIEE